MKYEGETEEDHIQECLSAVEILPDKDYYYLTVQCIKKLYKGSEYEVYVKEEILMQSKLYQEPYEKGMEKGIEKGIERGIEKGIEKGMEKGKLETLVKTAIKFLVKKFGLVPDELKQGLTELDAPTLEVIIDNILKYESLEDVKRYIQ